MELRRHLLLDNMNPTGSSVSIMKYLNWLMIMGYDIFIPIHALDTLVSNEYLV